MMDLEPQKLLDLINRHPWWYHTMNLGSGISTPGQYGNNLIPVANLIPHLNFHGALCLDIGTMDGKMAFLLEKLGGIVTTVDVFRRETVVDLIDAFSSSVTYVPGIRDSNLPSLRARCGYFDFVLCAGVLYHVFSPIDLISNVRKVIKNSGYAIFESACIDNDRKSYIELNWGDYYNEHTSIWIPTTQCLRRMLQYFGFEIIGESMLKEKVPRYAVLCKALEPSTVCGKTDDPWLAALLGKNTPGISSEYLLPQLDVDQFNAAPQSDIEYIQSSKKRIEFSLRKQHTYRAELALLEKATPCQSV